MAESPESPPLPPRKVRFTPKQRVKKTPKTPVAPASATAPIPRAPIPRAAIPKAAMEADVLWLIAGRLSRMDLVKFSIVCKLWRSIALSIKHFPGLLVTSNDSDKAYILSFNGGLFDQTAAVVKIPSGHVCHGCSHGWLLMISTDLKSSLLYNPFSTQRINLPPTTSPLTADYDIKAVISSNPSIPPPPFILMMYGGCLLIGKVGGEKWLLECQWEVADGVYFENRFYVINFFGVLNSYELKEDQVILSSSISQTEFLRVPSYLLELHGEFFRLVLLDDVAGGEGELFDEYNDNDEDLQMAVEYGEGGEGELFHENDDDGDLQVDGEGELPDENDEGEDDDEDDDEEDRESDDDDDADENENNYQDNDEDEADFVVGPESRYMELEQLFEEDGRDNISGFKIQKFESESEIWVDVEGMGEVAAFVGANSSFAVQAAEVPNCIGNTIYFAGTPYLRGGIFGSASQPLPVSQPLPIDSNTFWIGYTPHSLGVSDL